MNQPKGWSSCLRLCCVCQNENYLFSERIYIWFLLYEKFSWTNSHAQQKKLVFNSMSGLWLKTKK